MGRNKSLSDKEKQEICEMLAKKVEIIGIARVRQRDVRTIKKAVQNINLQRKSRYDKGKSMVSDRSVRKITRTVKRSHL